MVRKFLAVYLGFCVGLVALGATEAVAATKQEKLAQAEKAVELAPELTPLLHQESFPTPAQADKTIEIQYVVYFGGFHLATLDFIGTLTGDKYEIRSAISEAGKAFSESLQESFGNDVQTDEMETGSSAITAVDPGTEIA